MGKGRDMYKVLVGKPKEKGHLKDQGIDGRMGSKWTVGRLVGGVEWIHLAQDRDRRWAVVNGVMKLWVLAPQSLLVISVCNFCWYVIMNMLIFSDKVSKCGIVNM
jgi:hypothetical protein